MFANLHMHSTFSDGQYTPEELCALAVKQGHKAIALTDHDTCKGSYFMHRAARKHGLLCLTGTEFDADGFDTHFHIVGLDFDTNNSKITELFKKTSSRELIRSRILFDRSKENGWLKDKDITWEDVVARYPNNDYLCNNQIFVVLKEKGLATQDQYMDFFPDFGWREDREEELAPIINRPMPTVEETIEAIHDAGGVAILAHPHEQLQYIPGLVEMGIDGVEVNHPSLTEEDSKILLELAAKYNLYKSGGTDHSGVLGGLTDLGGSHVIADGVGVIDEESFMEIYNRVKG